MALTINHARPDEFNSSSNGGSPFKFVPLAKALNTATNSRAAGDAMVTKEGEGMLNEIRDVQVSERTTALSAENSGASYRSLGEHYGGTGYPTAGDDSHHTNGIALHHDAGEVSSAAPIAAGGVAPVSPSDDITSSSELERLTRHASLEIYAQLSNLEDDLDLSLSSATVMDKYGMDVLEKGPQESAANRLPPLAPRIAPREEEEKVEMSGEGGVEGAADEAGRQRCRGPGPAGIRLRRQGALSDLWQHQGAFRSNRRSMKSVFEEVGVYRPFVVSPMCSLLLYNILVCKQVMTVLHALDMPKHKTWTHHYLPRYSTRTVR